MANVENINKEVVSISNADHIRLKQKMMARIWEKLCQACSEDLRSPYHQTQRKEHITSYPKIHGLFCLLTISRHNIADISFSDMLAFTR